MWSFGQLLMTHTVNLSHLGKSELTISKVKPHNRTGELICRDSSKSRAHVGCDGNLSTEVNVYWSQCQPSVSVQERLPVVSLRTSQLDKVIAFYGSIQFSCKCDLPINNFSRTTSSEFTWQPIHNVNCFSAKFPTNLSSFSSVQHFFKQIRLTGPSVLLPSLRVL